MTKSELIEKLASEKGLPLVEAETVVNAIFQQMTQALSSGRRVEVRGFGSFTIREYKSYTGRNPRTNKTIDVKPKRLPYFRAGKELKDRLE